MDWYFYDSQTNRGYGKLKSEQFKKSLLKLYKTH